MSFRYASLADRDLFSSLIKDKKRVIFRRSTLLTVLVDKCVFVFGPRRVSLGRELAIRMGAEAIFDVGALLANPSASCSRFLIVS